VVFHAKARESWSDAKEASEREAVAQLREKVTFKQLPLKQTEQH